MIKEFTILQEKLLCQQGKQMRNYKPDCPDYRQAGVRQVSD